MQDSPSVSQKTIDQVDTVYIDNAFATAQISLMGAHILSFVPKSDQRDRLWLSDRAIFDNKTPIRGGIPICWPWFSDAHNQVRQDLPSHGFVRTQQWTLTSSQDTTQGTSLTFTPQNTQGPGWDQPCELSLHVLVGKSLIVELITKNTSADAFKFNCALHSYFRVSDINNVELTGLDGPYSDKTQDWQMFDTPEPYQFSAETDRIHLCESPEVKIGDTQSTLIKSSGHDSIVVWNPWQQNSTKMRDMSDDGFLTMLCIETALTQEFILGSEEEHRLRQEIF
ncbi:D-hexose-6-phosphate mutarotase [Aliiglaciecola sp. LCG003]|uniref:D-hexose-6-phosphate mutarotase n=1 Tax=Aliiglaciecola sp. LCG003 TaxID=3053655 RepID=UPI002573418E|nr:D-hexose-6-phosphate mutarotase [Aliiglaciecola sp. LCG003]WJG07855.1 D-hexose-6-phosphate mutarotase [Aliiglaciecola sp. LCG003]